MTGYEVDSAYLHGYAAQLRGNATVSMITVADYAGVHCRNFDRISGLLEPAQWISSFVADQIILRTFPALFATLQSSSDGLTQNAAGYDAAEQLIARRFEPGQGGGAGVDQPGTPQPPTPPVQPTALGFTDGADVAPKPPKDECLTGDVEERLNELLGEVASVVKYFTGYDIIAEWTPVLLGDWGALYRLAEAWGEVTHSVRAIHQDVTTGLDVLSPHWLAGDERGAAVAFDQHMRNRVFGGLDTLAEMADMVRAAHEYWAVSYKAIILNAFWLLDYYAVRFKSVVKRITQAIREATPNPITWIDLGEELFSIAEDYIDFIKTTIEAVETCIEQYRELGELIVQEIDMLISLVSWVVKAELTD